MDADRVAIHMPSGIVKNADRRRCDLLISFLIVGRRKECAVHEVCTISTSTPERRATFVGLGRRRP